MLNAARTNLYLRRLTPAILALACTAPASLAEVTTTPYPTAGAGDAIGVAAAPLSGWYAVADTFADRIEVRNQHGAVRRIITASELQALAPGLALDGGPDGPSGLTFSASGRLLFILLHDDTLAPNGQPSDAVLRYDLSSNSLSLLARLELFDRGDTWPRLGAAHHAGWLYVGTGAGQIVVFPATASATQAAPAATWTLPGGGGGGGGGGFTNPTHGIAIDRDSGVGVLYAATATGVYRTTLQSFPPASPTITQVCAGTDIRALAWGDHYGATSQRGLYILSGNGPGSRVSFLPAALAGSASGLTPATYTTSAAVWNSISPTADGRLLIGASPQPIALSDTSDTRLTFDAWMRDELRQSAILARGLISPDGEPSGWVIDADVLPGQTRFHPATPDGAAWAVLTLLMHERINGDPAAQQDVSRILRRHAGHMPTGPGPVRNADGIFKHWVDPLTGTTKQSWPDEFATLSTMKIVCAAARAMGRYPDDPEIVRAASRIIFGCRNWQTCFQPGAFALAFKGLPAGGPDTSSFSRPFHEGIIFAEQTGVYGAPPGAPQIAAAWFTRSLWPTATYLAGYPITTGAPGAFQPAFLSIYPELLSAPFRASAPWQAQIDNIRWSSAAFTDDAPARYYTVFSAGTSPGGYNADTFANHPGNLTTFTSLLGLCATGDPAEAVAGYAAYRKGARQNFKTGAGILYRRPYDGGTFMPNSAGLPDVSLGALGLAEVIQPGAIDALLARPYPSVEMCPQDVDGDGSISIDDLYRAVQSPTDLNGNSAINASDAACLEAWLRRAELQRMSRH